MAKIAQVAEKTNMTAYTLRYYEKEGLIRPPRDENGIRDFDEDSLRRIYAIMHYRRAGVSLAQIKEIFNSPDDDAFHLEILEATRKQLAAEILALEETMNYLDYKIEVHKGKHPKNISMEEWLAMWKENPALALKK
ncbi:MerR family transcriptional regulator [Lactococcus termiticola]|uniref:MerR family transcriptional regulator n=1 Tax=Lactococcus termiticola TaxID=2169526 RepID=A0A2R5HJ81_9LACT|nr:MerR family transcriptional regulator [Lactococcus termiticola]GBG96580.1 MerR family transcriptional regulator [Lactococcus termiticola]